MLHADGHRSKRASAAFVEGSPYVQMACLVRERASQTPGDIVQHAETIGVEVSRGRGDDFSGEPVRQGGFPGELAAHSRRSMVRGDEDPEFVGAFFPGVCAGVVAPAGEGGEGRPLLGRESCGSTLRGGPTDVACFDAIAEAGEAP